MSRLHDCISSFVNVVCSFVNRRSVINKASGSDDSLKSDIYSAGVYGVSELSNPRKQTSALNNDSDISVVSSASTSVSRTARPARTLLRTLFAMLVAAATLLAMLILPPVNKAFADEGARWDYGGTGYISGKGFDWADSTRDLSISYPRLWIKDGKKKITWTVTFNKNSYLLAHIRGGKIKIKGKKGYEYLHIEPHSPYNGHSAIPPEGAAWSGDRPLFMVFLPKGINNVSIDRRRTGYDNARYSFARWPYEWGKHGEDLKKWYKRYPEDVVADKLIQCSDGYECKDSAERDRKTQEFLNESWEQSWKKLTLIQNPAVKKSKWKWDKGKIDYDQSIASFDGSDNWNKYNGTHYDRGDGFDTFWNEALGEKRLGSGECTGESCKGYSLAEIKQWKSKFQVVLASWEQQSYAPAMEWKITGDYEDSIKNPELLPLIAGWNSNKTGNNYGDPFPGNKNQWQSKWSFVGPYDTDGDGIPDLSEFYLGTDPTKKTNILYPVYKPKMLNDYPKRSTKNPTDYGGTDNVPVTTYKEPITVKPFVNVGTWESDTFNPNLFHQDKNADGTNATSTDLHYATDLPGAENTAYLNMSYAITGVPDNGVTNNNWQGCDTNTKDGCVKIDPKTGYITYRPRKDDWKNYPDGLEFKVKVTHINPNIYPYNSDKNKGQAWEEKDVPVKIKVLSNASLYNPHYDETTVNYNPEQKKFNPTDSKEPKSVKTRKKPWVREGALPSGSTFKLEQYTKNSLPVLDWSKIDSKNTGNGKVTFSPSKTNAGESEKTPVLVTYPDGSTSKDSDAGNYSDIVYAPVKVGDLPVSGGDLNLGLYDGKSIDNKGFSGFSFRDKTNPHEIDKGKKMGLPDEDDKDPNKGIVFDSWANNGKGPITFRVICHRTDVPNSPYALLKPKEGNENASGEINGLHFEDFRQWIRDNDNRCKGKDCSNDNLYLHSREYENNTMERSRAMIGGTPKKGGSYGCKVFAFHEKYDDKNNHSGSLEAFDNAAKGGGSTEYSILFNNYETIKKDQKGSEWIADNFYFKVKLKDNQKYNPTYTKIPEFEVGTVPNGAITKISTDQPKSMKKITVGGKTENANGVSDADLEGVVDDNTRLPQGTWFSIKQLLRKVDNKQQPNKFKLEQEGEIWSQFEGVQSNKADGKDEAKDKDPKSTQEYGSVTFRPTKWQDAGEYWAEVVVHYPDGTTSDGDHSINKNHPIYAKVKVTRPKLHDPDINMQLRSQYNPSDGSVSGAWIGTSNDLAVIDKATGVTVMRGIGLMHDMGIDSWAETEVGPIYQKMLCTEKGKNNWYENLPGLNFQLGADRKEWKHSSFKQNEDCRKNGNCNPSDYLYNDYVDWAHSHNTMERTRASITNKTAPAKTGEYYCAVFTMKKSLEKAYVSNLGRDGHSANGVNLKLGNAVTGKDVTVQYFPVHVVEPFKLPKTGGEDCVNWNMLMSVVCVLGTGVMAAGFFLDQTKWGRAMLEALLRKALIKAFIRKTAEWCGGVMLRIEWWITERWRC